jgi:hypothetical protein
MTFEKVRLKFCGAAWIFIVPFDPNIAVRPQQNTQQIKQISNPLNSSHLFVINSQTAGDSFVSAGEIEYRRKQIDPNHNN